MFARRAKENAGRLGGRCVWVVPVRHRSVNWRAQLDASGSRARRALTREALVDHDEGGAYGDGEECEADERFGGAGFGFAEPAEREPNPPTRRKMTPSHITAWRNRLAFDTVGRE